MVLFDRYFIVGILQNTFTLKFYFKHRNKYIDIELLAKTFCNGNVLLLSISKSSMYLSSDKKIKIFFSQNNLYFYILKKPYL